MNVIIFSKNRPAQLDLLLRSIKEYTPFTDIKVIAKATETTFIYGYAICRDEHDAEFIWEKDLKQDTLDAIKSEQVMFLVDDDVFYSKTVFGLKLNPHETYSMRLHDGIKNKVHFDYKISLDGNVFRSEDIKPLMELIQFKNPNELEARLQGNFGRKFHINYNLGHVIGIPHNRVSDGSKCHFTGKYTERELAGKYNSGWRIKLPQPKLLTDVHEDIPYEFYKCS